MDYSNDEKQPNAVETCGNCGREIDTMAFKGTGYCCIDCKKAVGLDTSSVGTIMFVSSGEKAAIDTARANPNARLMSVGTVSSMTVGQSNG